MRCYPELIPIEINDDGLRVVRQGRINKYPFTVYENPELICEVVALRKRRQIVLDANLRRWS